MFETVKRMMFLDVFRKLSEYVEILSVLEVANGAQVWIVVRTKSQ